MAEKKPVKKPAAPKKVEKKPAAPKKVEKKPAAPKKVEKKPAAPKKVEKKPVVKEEVNYRNYHVVKRADGKWEVKYAGGAKAIKLFNTQKEAMEYTKIMAANQGGTMLVHNSKGANKGRIKKK